MCIRDRGDTDHGQDAQVHAHVHGDLGHQSAADAGADEGADVYKRQALGNGVQCNHHVVNGADMNRLRHSYSP